MIIHLKGVFVLKNIYQHDDNRNVLYRQQLQMAKTKTGQFRKGFFFFFSPTKQNPKQSKTTSKEERTL